ncbi:MAG: hypothetical protein H6618_08635 [Deltaproteobacteria bacterium]|nr:hypothetical protein [Deltaproteobacteria bacterium]
MWKITIIRDFSYFSSGFVTSEILTLCFTSIWLSDLLFGLKVKPDKGCEGFGQS